MYNGSGKNGSCSKLYNDNNSCSIVNFKREINGYQKVNGMIICIYIKNGMGYFFFIFDVNNVKDYLIIMYKLVEVDGDIQNIHENLLNWYLRHEY